MDTFIVSTKDQNWSKGLGFGVLFRAPMGHALHKQAESPQTLFQFDGLVVDASFSLSTYLTTD